MATARRERRDRLAASAGRCTSGPADAILRRSRARARAFAAAGLRRAAAARALATRPAGTRLLWAQRASGDYPVLVGRGLLGATARGCERCGRWTRARSRAFVRQRRTVARAARCARCARLPAARHDRSRARRHKTLAGAEPVWSALVAGGMTRADHLVALGGGVVGDLAGLLRRHLPARRPGRAGAHHARRPGRLRLRRQDRRRPARRPRTTSAPTTSRRACSSTPMRSSRSRPPELAAGWVEVLKTALIAGGSLWERVSASRLRAVDERDDPRLRAHEARGRRRRRARRRARARC